VPCFIYRTNVSHKSSKTEKLGAKIVNKKIEILTDARKTQIKWQPRRIAINKQKPFYIKKEALKDLLFFFNL